MSNRSATVVDRATGRLRREIVQGQYREGVRLPPERELCAALGISRLSLRGVLSRLKAEGLVASRHGSGTVVQPVREAHGLEVLGAVADAMLEAGERPVRLLEDLFAMRRMLAVEVWGLVHAKGADADSALEQALAKLEAVSDSEVFMEHDLRFAQTLVELADNMAMQLVFNGVVHFLRSRPELATVFEISRRDALAVYRELVARRRDCSTSEMRDAARELITRLDEATMKTLIRREEES